jgi:DNA replication protein DnaC
MGKEQCFTFDHVFNERSSQTEVYEKCVKELVMACFEGYNAAVLAYGQTGSGKTYTMGTGLTLVHEEQSVGLIPQVIK